MSQASLFFPSPQDSPVIDPPRRPSVVHVLLRQLTQELLKGRGDSNGSVGTGPLDASSDATPSQHVIAGWGLFPQLNMIIS